MLNINDTVLYGMDGICTVTDKILREIDGQDKEYYVLKPEYNNGYTIYVPVDNEKAKSKIRNILTADEIHDLILTMPDEDSMWIEDNNQRKSVYQQMLTSGERPQLIKLIKSIYLHSEERKKEGKRPHAADERYLKDAEKMLYEEFAHVLDIEPEQVVPFICAQLDVSETQVFN